jgi:ferritin-like metal-binding protein YciE
MARHTPLALQRQLKRERAYLQWLDQHLPQSTQLSMPRSV